MKAKSIASIISSLGIVLSTALFADSGANLADSNNSSTQMKNSKMPMFEQGAMIASTDQIPAAYNRAGGVRLMDSNDVWISGSFIYWEACSDDFDFGEYPNTLAAPQVLPGFGIGGSAYPLFPQSGGTEVFLKQKFQPGFKVALGYNSYFDDWSVFAEYTWLHFNSHSNFTAPTGEWFVIDHTYPYAVSAKQLYLKWRSHLDMVDFMISRASYMGKQLIMEPMFGLKAVWFTNNLITNTVLPTTDPLFGNPGATIPATGLFNGTVKTKSWGLGPRVGMHSQWLLGSGFRVDGKAAFSTLFTRYSKLQSSSNVPASNKWNHKYNSVRPVAELGLGFAWGGYCCDQSYHFDLCFTYDFNVFFDQSMMRSVADTTTYGSKTSPTNIVYHGPTFAFRFDF